MKIIYEATVIANAYRKGNSLTKTGVFRVAQQLFENLTEQRFNIALGTNENLLELLYFLEKHAFQCANTKADIRKIEVLKGIVSVFPKESFIERGINHLYWKLGLFESNSYQFDEALLNQFDIFHTPFHAFPKEVLATKSLKKLITIHDLIPKKFPELFGEWHYQNTENILSGINKETFVACVSDNTKEDLLHYQPNANPERIRVIPLAADESIFYQETNQEVISKTLKKYQIDTEKPYFLSVSTLEPRKNLQRTVEAFANLVEQQKLTDLQLVLVGSKGWKIDDLFQTLQAKPVLKNQIILTGFVEDEELAAIYSGALAFVYPSLYEGFGLPPLEAMQCGIPVITSSSSSLPEVVADAGILVEPTHSDAIANSMWQLYNQQALREELAKKSILQAKKFSWQKFRNQYTDFYQTMIQT